MNQPQTVYRKDYTEPEYTISELSLDFDLYDDESYVQAEIQIERQASEPVPLVLHGDPGLRLLEIAIDGEPLSASDYHVQPDSLTISKVPAKFVLSTKVAIKPQENTALNGLYMSSGNYCTQCEAMGFRRITYFLDRPDVMARYRCRVAADKKRFPVLLSNGNRIGEEELDQGRHAVSWEDPFLKPSYLFALVAGDLKAHRGQFTTMSGRTVDLEIWVEPQNIDKCEHALKSLQKSMKWDEECFGREYDLDLYMIVAVNDFNMGAMENKGLNLFNAKYVLAQPETATDDDYENIEGIIAHEYFHNWTGNRVTCRDWFQLTLKEGLTVFRDQQFTADMTSHLVKRIDDVRGLRIGQFAEDAGPMSHPIRPDSYISMDNFYTATVYSKGAEIIRMYHTLLGHDGFRKGMDLYFERHDGQAVTCDDFLAAMADANDVDLEQFANWYAQRGTPRVSVKSVYDKETQQLSLHIAQDIPVLKPGEENALPLLIPLKIGLIDRNGSACPLIVDGQQQEGDSYVFRCDELSTQLTFENLAEEPVVSLGRGFSAPVSFDFEQSDEDMIFLMAHDSDGFNRWQAGQNLANKLLLQKIAAIQAGVDYAWPDSYVDAFGRILSDDSLDGSFKSLMLQIPALRELDLQMEVVDVDAIHAARRSLQTALVEKHGEQIRALYKSLIDSGPYSADQKAIQRRRLKNTLLGLLSIVGAAEDLALAEQQYQSANNMTDSMAALGCLTHHQIPASEQSLSHFYERWSDDPIVLDKWFALQACSERSDAEQQVRRLMEHEKFVWTNPNRVRSLIGAFCAGNPIHFHALNGSGYALLGDVICEIQSKNPQLASRLVSIFNPWRRYDEARQALQRAQLERIAAIDGLSKDVFEIVHRALGD